MDKNLLTSPLVVICGTNASGKSALGIKLAQEFNGEIISADSRQIFEGFDLCCGKVTAEERALVPHHMLDVAKVGEHFSVSDYQKQVYGLIPGILERGRLPLIVGGTGLYIDSVVKGYDFSGQRADLEYRNDLEAKSVEELQAMLSDEARALIEENHADFNNKRRLSRLLEKDQKGLSMEPENQPMTHVLQIGVTWPREQLHARIDERLRIRMEQGMPEEVRSYLEEGGNREALYALGLEYKYITWYLEGRYSNEQEFTEALSTAIKQFAKRQVKWFKRNPEIRWVDMTADPFDQARELIRNWQLQQK